jgi:hypothetical protein
MDNVYNLNVLSLELIIHIMDNLTYNDIINFTMISKLYYWSDSEAINLVVQRNLKKYCTGYP